METLRIVKDIARIHNLTIQDERAAGAAFNEASGVIQCITDYLEAAIAKLDKQLHNPAKLYDCKAPDRHVAFILAERSALVDLLKVLTLKAEVVDDDPSGEYNE